MADIQAYYEGIAASKKELDEKYPSGFLFVTAVRNISKGNLGGGTVTEVSTRTAARHIVDITARPSTQAEIDAHKQRGLEFRDEMARRNFERKQSEAGGLVVMNMGGQGMAQPTFVPPSEMDKVAAKSKEK